MTNCKKKTTKKYKNRKSPSYPANECKNKIKVGNDKNKWKSIKNKNGVYRWVLQKKNINNNIIDITKFRGFKIIRNNSVIVPKKNKKHICTLNSKGTLYIKLSSKYVPKVNNLEININLKKIQFNDGGGYVILMFKHKFALYDIWYKDLKFSKMKIVKDLLLKYGNKKKYRRVGLIDSMKQTKDHHYGDLKILDMKMVKKMKKNNKYYLVWGQIWDTDYTGKSGIIVFKYDNHTNYSLYGTIYRSDGTILYEKDDDVISISNSYFGTGTGEDPVHVITKFRRGFKPPAGLPKAKLLK